MNSVTIFIKRSPLAAYFVMAFAFTWAILGLAVLAAQGIIALPLSAAVFITLATLGPAIAAIIVSQSEGGRSSVRALLAQAGRWRVKPIWYAIALIGPALIMLAAFLLWRILGGPSLSPPPLNAWLSVPILVVVLLIPALFEEIGWRGLALPRLQSRYGALAASLIIGVAWAVWHLPIWFIPEAGFSSLPFPIFAAFTVAISVLFTWLYNGSGGSVLLPALAHAAINAMPLPWNTAVYLLPEAERGLHLQIPVTVVLVALAVLLAFVTMKPIPPTEKLANKTPAPSRRRGFTSWLWRVPLALALFVIGLGAVGTIAQIIAVASDNRTFPPPGRLIDVGGYEMHVYCNGEGSPMAILDSASLDTVSGWHWMQTELAKSTRVCAYDRPGLGWSDLGPEPRDAEQNARQLHTLLAQAGIPGPYVLVGHSLGGLYMRIFAAQYPDEVAGMVLIEGTHPDFLARLGQPDVMPNADEGMLSAGPVAVRLGLFRLITFVSADPDLPLRQQGELAAYYASNKFADRMLSVYQQFPNLLAQTRAVGDLGDKPVMVVIGGASDNATGIQRQLQDEFLTLSSNSQLRLVEEATHMSLVHHADHALKTSAAILEIVAAVRKG